MYTIISSIISALAAIFVCFISQNDITRKWTAQFDKQTSLIEVKLEVLTETVKEHTEAIRRTFEIEKQCGLFGQKIEELDRRITVIEERTD